MRKLQDAARFVADRREVADLRAPDQSLVFRIFLRDRVQEKHVLDRWKALQIEVLQAPEVKALAEHRMDAPIKTVLLVGVAGRAEGEILHGRMIPGSGDCDDDSADGPRKTGQLKHGPDFR